MISKIMMFAMSIASRGANNKKINDNVKKLRYISCYGLGEISPCKNLKKMTIVLANNNQISRKQYD